MVARVIKIMVLTFQYNSPITQMSVYQPEIGTMRIKLIETQAIIRQENLNIMPIILTRPTP